MDVGGLHGALADAQTPTAHAASHEADGTDELSIAGLSGIPEAAGQNSGLATLGPDGTLTDTQRPPATVHGSASHNNGTPVVGAPAWHAAEGISADVARADHVHPTVGAQKTFNGATSVTTESKISPIIVLIEGYSGICLVHFAWRHTLAGTFTTGMVPPAYVDIGIDFSDVFGPLCSLEGLLPNATYQFHSEFNWSVKDPVAKTIHVVGRVTIVNQATGVITGSYNFGNNDYIIDSMHTATWNVLHFFRFSTRNDATALLTHATAELIRHGIPA
jgi:hypothetical protein